MSPGYVAKVQFQYNKLAAYMLDVMWGLQSFSFIWCKNLYGTMRCRSEVDVSIEVTENLYKADRLDV